MNSPGPVEILRAAQKDDIFIDKFQQEIQGAVESLLGQGNVLKWSKLIKYLSVGAYYSCTNLAGFQTLGEEYAGLVQTDASFRRVPTKMMTAAMIVIHTFGPMILERSMKAIGDVLTGDFGPGTSTGREGESESESVMSGARLMEVGKHCLPLLRRLHLVIFYMQGRFYHLSKRLTGIHYFLVRRWFANQDENSKRNLKYLRMMSVVNLIFTACRDGAMYLTSRPATQKNTVTKLEAEQAVVDPTQKCSLCLEVRRNTSCTPCGHLFCWNCIMDWLQTKEECPICRTQVSCSRVVPLQNHS